MKQKLDKIKQNNTSESSHIGIIELWCLRILLQLGGHRKFISKSGFSSDEVLAALSLEEYGEKDVDRPAFMKILKKKYELIEKIDCQLPSNLQENIGSVQKQLSLNDVEASILAFTVMLQSEEALEECADTLGQLDKNKVIKVLATVLGFSQQNISKALAVKGQLALSGVVKIDMDWNGDLDRKLELMSGLGNHLMAPRIDSESLFSSCYFRGIPAKLKSDDFSHLQESYGLIKNYLSQAIKVKSEGINILIHGLPGSGKSEMVRSILQDIEAEAYEISMEDNDGDAMSGSARFSAYQLSQQILRRTDRAVILFDEIEDVFPDSGEDSRANGNLAQIKKLGLIVC